MFPSLFRQVGTKGYQAIVLQGESNVELWDDCLRKCILAEDPTGLLSSVLFNKPNSQFVHLNKSDLKWQKANLDCVLFLQSTLSTHCLYMVMGMDNASMMYKRLLYRYSIDTLNHSNDLMLSLLNIRQQEKQDVQTYLANIDKQFAICRFYDQIPTFEQRMKSLIDGLSSIYNFYRDDLIQQMHSQLTMVQKGKCKPGEAYEHLIKCILVLHQRKRFDVLVNNEPINLPKATAEEYNWWQSTSNLMAITAPQPKEEQGTSPPPPQPVIVNWVSQSPEGTKNDEKAKKKKEEDYQALKESMDRILQLLETRFAQLNHTQSSRSDSDKQSESSVKKSISSKEDKIPVLAEKVVSDRTNDAEKVNEEKSEKEAKVELTHEAKQSDSPNEDKHSSKIATEKDSTLSQENKTKNTETAQLNVQEEKVLAPSSPFERVKKASTERIENGGSTTTKGEHTTQTEVNEKGVKAKPITNTVEEIVGLSKDSVKEEAAKEDHLPLNLKKSASIDHWQKVIHDSATEESLTEDEIINQLPDELQEHEMKEDSIRSDSNSKDDEEQHSNKSKDAKDEEIEEYLTQTESTL